MKNADRDKKPKQKNLPKKQKSLAGLFGLLGFSFSTAKTALVINFCFLNKILMKMLTNVTDCDILYYTVLFKNILIF